MNSILQFERPTPNDGGAITDVATGAVTKGSAGKLKGKYTVKCFRADGSEAWVDECENSITYSGINYLLGTALHGDTQSTTWYVGLVNATGFTAFAPSTDTMASHSGWTAATNFSQTALPAWGPNDSANQAIGNTTAVVFSMNAAGSIKGIYLTSNATLGASTGTLFSEAAFAGGTQTVNSGDTLQVTYTVSLTSN